MQFTKLKTEPISELDLNRIERESVIFDGFLLNNNNTFDMIYVCDKLPFR